MPYEYGMPVISRTRIEQYLNGFAPSDSHRELKLLLRLAFLHPLKNDPRYLAPITNPDELQSKSLKEEFNRRRDEPWFFFAPNDELNEIVTELSNWLMNEIYPMRRNYSGTVRTEIRRKMSSFSSISKATAMMGGPVLTPEEFEDALHKRLVPDEERKEDIEWIADLPGRHFLAQIKSAQGMINAGKNAGNCLGSLKFPLRARTPHRERVLFPDRWLYFSIRDADNKSVVTIGVEVREGRIHMQGNNEQPIAREHRTLAEEAYDIIRRRFLELDRAKRPYGALEI